MRCGTKAWTFPPTLWSTRASLAGFDRRAPLDQRAALRRHGRETVPAGVAVQRVERERGLAPADALVVREEGGADPRRRFFPLRHRALALGRDAVALPRQSLAQRRLLRPHLLQRLLRLRGPALR